MHVNRHIYWLLTENSSILPKKKVINNYYDRVCVFVFKWNELHSTMRKLHGRHIFFKVLTKLHIWKNNIRKTIFLYKTKLTIEILVILGTFEEVNLYKNTITN